MKKRALLPILGILLLAHAPSTALGQELTAGDTIRVKPSRSTEPKRRWAEEQPKPRWTEATVLRLTPDTLWYQSSGSVSLISMDIADIQRPTHRDHRWLGLAIGAVTVGAYGAVIAHNSFAPNCINLFTAGPSCSKDPSHDNAIAIFAVLGAGLGAGLGYSVGMLFGHWETVELDQITVGDGNLGVSLSIRR